jgi:hypothetical protein
MVAFLVFLKDTWIPCVCLQTYFGITLTPPDENYCDPKTDFQDRLCEYREKAEDGTGSFTFFAYEIYAAVLPLFMMIGNLASLRVLYYVGLRREP